MNKTKFTVLLITLCGTAAHATINWSVGTAMTDESNTPLIADPFFAPSGTPLYDQVGYFVQLIWAGPNGTIDALDEGVVNGAGQDDVVLDTTFVGNGQVPPVDGFFGPQSGPEAAAGQTGQSYFLRAFNAASTSDNANILDNPTQAFPGTATFYGDSNLLATSDPNAANGENLVFNGFQTNNPIGVIPEPRTLALFGAGLAGLLALRRRKA